MNDLIVLLDLQPSEAFEDRSNGPRNKIVLSPLLKSDTYPPTKPFLGNDLNEQQEPRLSSSIGASTMFLSQELEVRFTLTTSMQNSDTIVA